MTLAEYFAAHRYHGKWQIGDRVEGKWNGVPFVGSVGNDSVVNESIGPQVSIHLDLPILYKGTVHNYIKVKPKEIKSRT